MKKQLKVMLLVSACASLTLVGCTTAIIQGDVVSVTSRGFGLRIKAVTPDTQSPEMDLGAFSQTVVVVPTSKGTNNTGMNTNITIVPVAATAALDNNGKLFTTGANETFATGNYRTGAPNNPTNVVAAEPATPK